jgi:hypothetical protein
LGRVIFRTLKDKRRSQRLRVLQVNLHHSRAALATLSVAMRNHNVALIQEPWTCVGEIEGLKEVGGELIYNRSNQNPRTCILVKKDFWVLLLMHYCFRDLTVVKVRISCGRGQGKLFLNQHTFHMMILNPHPPREDGEAGGRM